MDTTLLEILRRTSSCNNDKPTHKTIYGPSQEWGIKDTEWETFWLDYCKNVYEAESSGKHKNYCLAELPKRYMPLMVECKLQFHRLKGRDETYDWDFILHIIYCYQQKMLELLNITHDSELYCCVLETDELVEDNLIVARFKLQFPFCKTLPSVQTNTIRPEVIKMLRIENVLARCHQQPINDWEDIIDPTTALNPCVMYGSSVNEKIPAMILERIIGKVEFDDISLDKAEQLELDEVFRYEHHEHLNQQLVSSNMFNQGDYDFWLPMFLSLSYYVQITTPKSEAGEKSSIRKSSSRMDSDKSIQEDITPEDMSEKFLGLLGIHRSEKEIFWLDVGKALYTTFRGSPRGLDLWIYFTEKSDVYTADDCKDYYNTLFGNKITVKTLAWYAREDSPEEYARWHNEWYYQAIEMAFSALDNDVAEAIYRVYWLEFACSKQHNNSLYYFDNHIWKKLDNGQTLRVMISKDFIKILEGVRIKIGVEIYDSNDNKHKDSAELVMKKINKLISRLKTRNFKNNVIGEILEKFYIDDFESKLDSHDSLLGCFNGVLEATDTEAVLRPGKPEDYVSKTTGLIYRNEYTWDTPLVKDVDTWMNQIFPDKDLCKYAGKLLGSCIRGRNSEKLFAVLTGQGDNSKSMLKKALESCFGPYCITFPTTIFTAKRASSGPIPELARAKAVRVAMVQEPDSDDAMRNGAIKEFTGGDRFFARMCNENGGEIDAMFKLFLMCNHVPIIPHCDQAIKNRFKIVPFLSTWVKNAPQCKEEQYKQRLFPIDPRFERKIPRMAPAFMWWLVQMYNLYCNEGLKEPEIIAQHTEEYWKDNDIYIAFITDNVEYSRKPMPDWPVDKDLPIDEDAKLSLTEVFTRFRDWYAENYPGHKCPDKGIMKSEINKRLKQKCFSNTYNGVKFKLETVQL